MKIQTHIMSLMLVQVGVVAADNDYKINLPESVLSHVHVF